MEIQLQIKFKKYYNDTVFRNGPSIVYKWKKPLFFLSDFTVFQWIQNLHGSLEFQNKGSIQPFLFFVKIGTKIMKNVYNF